MVLLIVIVGLSGCGSSSSKETDQTDKKTESTSTSKVETSATKTSSSEKRVALKEVTFEVEGTNYTVKILDSWKVLANEEASFDAGPADESEGILINGFKKTDVEGFDAFKNVMKEQMVSDEEFQIKEETIKEEAYQSPHYSGELYSFRGNSKGVKTASCFYFLETETEYVVLGIFGLPSFFDKNNDLVTEMANSFVAV